MNFQLVGGPFDGAYGKLDKIPGKDTYWVTAGSPGPFGLWLHKHEQPGAERYDRYKQVFGVTYYKHESVSDDLRDSELEDELVGAFMFIDSFSGGVL